MRTNKLLAYMLILLVFTAFTATATMASDPSKPVVLRWAHILSPKQLAAGTGIDQSFADKVEKRTGGRVKMKIYWSQTLAKLNEVLGLLNNGTVDMGSFYTAVYPSQFPLWAAPNSFPFVMTTLDEAYQMGIQAPRKIRGLQEEIRKQNIKVFYHHIYPTYALFSTRPITKFDDLKGLKIRSLGTHYPKAYKAAGAVGVWISHTDVYESLRRGVVDAVAWPSFLTYALRLHEAAKHMNRWDMGSIVAYGTFMNLDVWNKLPPDVQKIIEEVGKETSKADYGHAIKIEKATLTKLKAEGVTIHDVPASERQKWIAACPDFLEEWVKELDKQGKGNAAREMRDLWLEIVRRY